MNGRILQVCLLTVALLGFSLGAHAQSPSAFPYAKPVPNDTLTGTTQFTLTKINSSGNAVIMASTDSNGYAGVCVSNCGKVGTAWIAFAGLVPLTMENTTTADHYVTIGSTTGGDGHDSGATTYPTSGAVIGRVQTGASSGNVAMVDLFNGEIQASAGSTLTADSVSAPRACVAASGSGTAYTCTTSPTFSPAAHDEILFKADVANTGAATLNVNSSSAAGLKKQGGGTALVANDLLASQWTVLVFDGTNWQMQGQTGNAAAGSGAASTVIPLAKTANYTLTSSDFQSSASTSIEAIQFTISSATLVAATLPSSAPAQVASQDACVLIENSISSAPYPLYIYSNGKTLDGVTYSASSPTGIEPGKGVRICSNGSNYLVADGAIITNNTYSPLMGCTAGGGQSVIFNAANEQSLWKVVIPQSVIAGHIIFDLNTHDATGTDFYMIGIYNSAGSLVAATPSSQALSGTTGAMSLALSPTVGGSAQPVILPAGIYGIGMTGNANVAQFEQCTTQLAPYNNNNFGGGGFTTGGNVVSSITWPADTIAFTAGAAFMFELLP